MTYCLPATFCYLFKFDSLKPTHDISQQEYEQEHYESDFALFIHSCYIFNTGEK
ncbi:hypothetical protein VCHA40P242_80178 [Vibrio chagasii]|nr:hypothetical protein VCHA36P164_100034 [Vibrio chagasii]CAH7376072.1 hypothetical protein VCHA40P242_80178 [Vibrio chagasii]